MTASLTGALAHGISRFTGMLRTSRFALTRTGLRTSRLAGLKGTDMADSNKLPPLPKAFKFRREQVCNGGYRLVPSYTEDEMRSYALAAISRLEAAADHVPDAGEMVPELSREDVVRLAREAGLAEYLWFDDQDTPMLQRFASLVRSVPVEKNHE